MLFRHGYYCLTHRLFFEDIGHRTHQAEEKAVDGGECVFVFAYKGD